MLGVRWSLSFHHETKCLSLFRAVFQMGSLVGTVWHPHDRVSGDFKQKWRLPLPIFVCVCKDLQELVTIYRTAVKTACIRGCLKESDMKGFVMALGTNVEKKIMLAVSYTLHFHLFLCFFCATFVNCLCDSCSVFFVLKYEGNVTTNELKGWALFSKGSMGTKVAFDPSSLR